MRGDCLDLLQDHFHELCHRLPISRQKLFRDGRQVIALHERAKNLFPQ